MSDHHLEEGENDDFDEYDEEEDEVPVHHNWLEGHSALKFLLAGGIAGAGKQNCLSVCLLAESLHSFPNMHCTLRSSQDLPHHATP